jgi:hypothetical protein
MTPDRVTEKSYPNSQTLKEGIKMTSRMRSVAFKALAVGLASLILVFAGSSNATLAGGDPPPPGFITVLVQGQAKLCTDGKPAQGVLVTVFSEKNSDLTAKTTTNAEGKFSVTAILFGANAHAALPDLVAVFSGFTVGEMQTGVIAVPFPVPTTIISISTCLLQLDRGPDQNVQCCEEKLRFDGADFVSGKTDVLQAPPDPPFRVVELQWRIHIRWFCRKVTTIPKCIGTFNVAARFIPDPAPLVMMVSLDSLEAKCDGRHKSGTINVKWGASFPGARAVEGTVELTFTPKGGKGNHKATLRLPFRAWTDKDDRHHMEYGEQQFKEERLP